MELEFLPKLMHLCKDAEIFRTLLTVRRSLQGN